VIQSMLAMGHSFAPRAVGVAMPAAVAAMKARRSSAVIINLPDFFCSAAARQKRCNDRADRAPDALGGSLFITSFFCAPSSPCGWSSQLKNLRLFSLL
jgi:hypothetical protein